jgi:FtsH-binding integral membrane protein
VNREPRVGLVPVGPLVAAAGALLLIVSLFLDWWTGATAFTAYEFLDLLLVLLALATIASLAGGLGLVKPAVSPGVSLAVSLFTIFVVLSQVVNDPPAIVDSGRGHAVGIWLALGGAALMVAGAVLGYAQISLAIQARRRDGDRPPAP